MRIAGLVLAGGSGARLGGRDKAMIALGGTTLVARAVARLSPQVAAVAISANGPPDRFAAFGLPVLSDRDGPGQGPLAGVIAGLGWAGDAGCAALVTVAVDTPFFPADLAARLAAGCRAGQAAVAADATGLHPTFALWPVAALPVLQAALASGQGRLRAAAAAIGFTQAEFPAPGGCSAFFNINTPGDIAEAARRASGP